jgi:signal transduction histidine kinase
MAKLNPRRSGRLEARRESGDLADIARSSARLLEPLANGRQIQLISHLQPTPVLCDSAQLAQVVTNLFSNAINHNPPGGHASLSVCPSNERAVVTVADDGAGISPDDQKRIFERFYQADESRSRQQGQGSGLGLAIVAEILAAHQGTIEVNSQPGEGSTFTVTLPLRKSDAAS